MKPTRKTAIMTGSASGIGFESARIFLGQGWNVVINGRSASRLKHAIDQLNSSIMETMESHESKTIDFRIVPVVGNIGDRNTGASLVSTAVQQFGRVDLLVNNAGTFSAKPFVEVSESDLDHFLHGNLKGTFLTTQAVVSQMLNQAQHPNKTSSPAAVQGSPGSIVNIGTVLINHALTTSLAAELAPHRIRVNCVAPGIVRTPLHANADLDPLAKLAMIDRIGDAREIAEAIAYLTQAEFVTGHILHVDGGYVGGRRLST